MKSIKNISVALGVLGRSVSTLAFHCPASFSTRRQTIPSHGQIQSKSAVYLSQSPFDEPESYEQQDSFQGSYEQEIEYEQPPMSRPQRQNLDPLVASLTRIDETAPPNTPTTNVPFLGEIPADGNLALLVPAAAIAALGLIFSVVVAFNARDEIVQELSQVELPKMEYTPTVVEEGVCRGLCSSQESDLEGLRGFMEGLGK